MEQLEQNRRCMELYCIVREKKTRGALVFFSCPWRQMLTLGCQIKRELLVLGYQDDFMLAIFVGERHGKVHSLVCHSMPDPCMFAATG